MDLKQAMKAINKTRRQLAPPKNPSKTAEEKEVARAEALMKLYESLRTGYYSFMATNKETGQKERKTVKNGASKVVELVISALKKGATAEDILHHCGPEFLNVDGFNGDWTPAREPIETVIREKAHRKVKGSDERKFNQALYEHMMTETAKLFFPGASEESDESEAVAAE